jgi:hypothetical protein
MDLDGGRTNRYPGQAGRPAGIARLVMIPLLVALACAGPSLGCSGDDADRPALASTRQAAPAPLLDTITAPNAALRAAVSDYIIRAGGDASTEYSIARLDLDGDGVEEGLVLLTGAEWCGSGGCTLLVFHARDGDFRFVSETSMVNGPVVVAPARSNGWRDILVPDPDHDRTIALRFNGAAYPSDPIGPAVRDVAGDTVFEGEIGLF